MSNFYKWFWGNILGRKDFYAGHKTKRGAVVALYIYVSAFLGYNFNLIWIYVKHFTGFDIQSFFKINSKIEGLLLTFSLMSIFFVINYFFLFSNNIYEMIIDDFTAMMDKKEITKNKENLIRMSVLIGFILLTFLNLFIVTEIL